MSLHGILTTMTLPTWRPAKMKLRRMFTWRISPERSGRAFSEGSRRIFPERSWGFFSEGSWRIFPERVFTWRIFPERPWRIYSH
ncbi:unnamed protein product, partial [Clonostachys rosea]